MIGLTSDFTVRIFGIAFGWALQNRSRTMRMSELASAIREAWLDGYQRAIDAMRSWAEEFAHDDTKAAVLTAAAMIEAAKPSETL